MVSQNGVQPFALHPDNPRYFLFRGKPTVIVTSGEHYGAVLNLDFDYKKYLKALADAGLNNTRTFTGAYVERFDSFNITRNTLGPEKGRFICPWARSDQPGYANGGNKFDLDKWDDAYFARLTDFLETASGLGIIVELDLFCPFYVDDHWTFSPMNATNNINGLGAIPKEDVYTLDRHAGLLAVQEAMVRKIVHELRGFDNLYYEICNEPYARDLSQAWHDRITDFVVDAEREFERKHLISWNVANHKGKVEKPHPGISIFNFHYASPPIPIEENAHLNRPIGDNETGFNKGRDTHYRMEGWEFLLAGGALYNNLDYSFTVGHEDGSYAYPDSQPGGGSAELRRSLRTLKEFIESFEFLKMSPDRFAIQKLAPEGARATTLSQPGMQYASYIYGGGQTTLTMSLTNGSYNVEWLDVMNGNTIKRERIDTDGSITLVSPDYKTDIALRIRRA